MLSCGMAVKEEVNDVSAHKNFEGIPNPTIEVHAGVVPKAPWHGCWELHIP